MRDSSGGSSGPAEGRPVDALVPRPAQGRRYTHHRRVRVSDAGPEGALRLDSLARYLQDVATDDWADAGLSPRIWVVRRTTVQVAGGGRWPALGEDVDLTTWCGGTGPAWAERRTDLEANGVPIIETVALWVPLDTRDARCGSGRSSTMFTEKRRRSAGVGPGTGRPKLDRDDRGDRAALAYSAGRPRHRRPRQQCRRLGGRDRGRRRPGHVSRSTHHGPLENGHTVPCSQARAGCA